MVIHRVELPTGGTLKFALGDAPLDAVSRSVQQAPYRFPDILWPLLQGIGRGATVLDLGAHVGTFALPAAALGYRVIAVEASPTCAALLRAAVAANGFQQVDVVEAAVWSKAGTMAFVEDGPYGHLTTDADGSSRTEEVTTVTVDELVEKLELEEVAFIKIDIEGAEVAALQGMENLLRGPAVLLCESNGARLAASGHTPRTVLSALASHGRRCFLFQPGRLMPVGRGEMQPSCVVDYLAVRSVEPWAAAVVGPMTAAERRARVTAERESPTAANREYIAAELARFAVSAAGRDLC